MTPLFFLNLKVMFEKVNGLGVLLWEVKDLWRLHKELLGKKAERIPRSAEIGSSGAISMRVLQMLPGAARTTLIFLSRSGLM